ncbi:MAG: hypothetical protein RQ824_03505 [bacterium]|nr:hypothetical protein [bacterium]
MGSRAVIIFEEKGCPSAAVDKLLELNQEGELSELDLLKVIDHPPMQWCEHGGADNEESEHTLDNENRRKRGEWALHQKDVHGQEVNEIAETLKRAGIDNIRVKFLEKEISFSSSVVNELNDSDYDLALISEKSWDVIEGKKIKKSVTIVTI